MIGLLILVVRTRTPASLIPETYGPSKVHIPKAPALGLLLEQPQFESYNRRVKDANASHDKRLSAGKVKDDVDQEGMKKDPVAYSDELLARVDAFKKEQVYDKMYAEEVRDDT